MFRKLFSAAALLAAATAIATAQTAGPQQIKITGVNVSLEKTPEFTIGIGPQRKAPSQDWLWIEVSFLYRAAVRTTGSLDDLTLNYYVLLNNPSPQNRNGTLLTGSVNLTGVISGTDVHRSVMLVSPQVLRGAFAGKSPASPATMVQAIGVTASIQGQIQDELSTGKGKGARQWWTSLQQGPPGLVLSKEQTPFAPLFYDYFEAVKAKTGN